MSGGHVSHASPCTYEQVPGDSLGRPSKIRFLSMGLHSTIKHLADHQSKWFFVCSKKKVSLVLSLCIIFPVKISCPASILLMSVTCIPGQHFALKYYQTWLLFFHTFKFVAKLFDSSTCSVGRSSNSASLWHQQPKESNSGTGRKESQHYFIWCQQWVHHLCFFWIEFGASLSNQLLQKIFLISLL